MSFLEKMVTPLGFVLRAKRAGEHMSVNAPSNYLPTSRSH